MSTALTTNATTATSQAAQMLRQHGNPFRNYFARNPDDEICARYHVPDLYAQEREQLLAVVDLYRADAAMPSEVVPVQGNKGAGKTHLLHSIKHGPTTGWQLLVTPGTFQKGTDFAEYVLFQLIDTLLGGSRQRGKRPIEFIGEELTRRLLRTTLQNLDEEQRATLFPTPTLARWVRRFGFGSPDKDRGQWLLETLALGNHVSVRNACQEAQVDLAQAAEMIAAHLDRTEPHNAAGQMRRRICQGFVRAVLLGDESSLANFLTDGFAALDFQVRPSRQDLVLALLKVLMDLCQTLHVPVVVAFDQLEDLLLARRTDDGHRVAEAFFAGIVQLMHQVSGLCFLIFVERGLWNRFVPSLDGYIQDRLNHPIHLPKHGSIKTLRLEAPPVQLVRQVVAARLRPALDTLPTEVLVSDIFPFSEEEIDRVAKTEPTLRDMLQQFRRLFDQRVFGAPTSDAAGVRDLPPPAEVPPTVKSVVLVEAAAPAPQQADAAAAPLKPAIQPAGTPSAASRPSWLELWKQQMAMSRAQLEPEGALTGATRELQAGLGQFLQTAFEHGVKVGPWRLKHVVPELAFGEHPTYGSLSLAHWAGKDGQPWRLGIGLFLGRGPGKLKDLQTKLAAFQLEPPVVDQLILLRPADDVTLTGKSKTLWDEAVSGGRHVRLEPMNLDDLAVLYGFPRWLAAVHEAEGATGPLAHLADFLQEQGGSVLGQLAMPVAA
ncbi:MAG TPA: hypothetical protein PKD86_18770 [Gemmatales bacterium]|nr:hypothetical protein [Gemmatales bacterium]HMP61389.1 hypothetical protein [Gemmatales bacterium]